MVNKNSRPCEAADFYHPTRPLTAGFHVARRNNECPLRATSGRSLLTHQAKTARDMARAHAA
jgi:hypothetical protein